MEAPPAREKRQHTMVGEEVIEPVEISRQAAAKPAHAAEISISAAGQEEPARRGSTLIEEPEVIPSKKLQKQTEPQPATDSVMQQEQPVQPHIPAKEEETVRFDLEVDFNGRIQVFSLKPGDNRIGRPKKDKVSPDIPLPDPEKYISGNHAVITVRNGHHFLIDLGSDNGTRLNGKRITDNEEIPLKVGDVIDIEGRKLRLVNPDVTRVRDADDLQ